MDEGQGIKGTQAFAKSIAVLNQIADAPRPMRFVDLQATSGMPKGTLHRILAALIDQRLVRLHPRDQTYRLGPRLFELAHRVWADFDLRDAAAAELARLAELWQGTAHLAVPDGRDALIIDLVEAPQRFRLPFGVGRRLPSHASALGKAILAFQPSEQRQEMLRQIVLEPTTERSLTDPDLLVRELDLAVIRGYAIDDEELETGIRCVAAPILDHTGVPMGAVSVSQPAFRTDIAELHATARDVMDAARQIAGNAGATPVFSISTPPRPAPRGETVAQCVQERVGINPESPLWDPRQGTLFWVDMLELRLGRLDRAASLPLDEIVSCIAIRRSGGLVAATRHGLATLDTESGRVRPLVAIEADRPRNRPNDGGCDRKGRFWVGTMAMDGSAGQGSLYRVEADLSVARIDSGFGVSNGIAWSPDDRWLYFTDSRVRTIFRYPFDLASGTVGQRQPFLELESRNGNPAGICIDQDGYLWCANWDGWCVLRIDPAGRIVDRVAVPVPRPTSCRFGGPDRRRLYVTTARTRLSRELLAEAPLSGSIFATDVAVPGMPEPAFAG